MRQRPRSIRHNARHWATPLVLAMLSVRALIPAGYMLAGIDGQLRVVLCDTAVHGAGHVHHHGSAEHPGPLHAHPDPTCPYAQSAGPAPLPALPVLAAAPVADHTLLPAHQARAFTAFGPDRQQTPRGPPRLA